MYMQAMRGSLQIALDYANKMIEIAHSADGCGYAELVVQEYRENKDLVRQERAVILRLMGRYDEALKEFEDILATEEDYECLIQTSYLKHLMEDESGALEYARRAKKIEPPEICKTSYGAFRLSGFKTLPNEYRLWLLKVDAGSVGPASSSVAGMSSVQPPPEACTERALPARTPIHLRPLYTPNCHHFCTEGT
jgi:tetratricopeptide (TPR) repeat protein